MVPSRKNHKIIQVLQQCACISETLLFILFEKINFVLFLDLEKKIKLINKIFYKSFVCRIWLVKTPYLAFVGQKCFFFSSQKLSKTISNFWDEKNTLDQQTTLEVCKNKFLRRPKKYPGKMSINNLQTIRTRIYIKNNISYKYYF